MKKEVKKHVSAIHIKGTLSLLERKISNVLLLNAYDNLMTAREHQISTAFLAEFVGFNSHDLQKLKEALQTLVTTAITWDIMGDDGKAEWGVSTLLAQGKIKAGLCTYAYSPALAEKLYNPEIYARINLSVQRKFSSGYALTLYENCLRYKNIGSTGWIELALLKRLLGVDNLPLYEKFKYLNDKIIKPSVKEINHYADILVEAEFRKLKRSVVAVRFMISENRQLLLMQAGDNDNVKLSDVYTRLVAHSITEKLVRQWLEQYGEEYLIQKLEYVESQAKLGHIKGSVAGFLVAAITNNYQTSEPLKKLAIKKKHPPEQEKNQRAQHEQQKIEDYLASLTPEHLAALQHDFLQAHQADRVIMQQYRKNGFKSAAVRALLRGYAKQFMPDEESSVLV